jgi:hypothetical protein
MIRHQMMEASSAPHDIRASAWRGCSLCTLSESIQISNHFNITLIAFHLHRFTSRS